MAVFDPGKQPTAPGVYLMKDAAGTVLYVGKAKNLRTRLRSYLKAERDSRPQIRFLMERTAAVETIVTDTEKEALILENTLIKQHRPRYNIHLRDDKTFVSLRIDPRETFPGLELVRRVRQDGARYFGPYASASAVRETLKEIYRIFPLRHYPVATCRRRGRPCLFHQIGQCSAPCHGRISPEEYRRLVDGVLALLSGRQDEVLSLLRQRMQQAASELRYEEAARLRDQFRAIEETVEGQKSVRHGGRDRDVIGLHRAGGEVEVALLFFRQGTLSGRRAYNLDWLQDEDQLLEELLVSFYGREVPIPDEILLPRVVEGAGALAEWLSERRGRKVRLLAPQRGEARQLLEMARRNAEESWKERGSRREACAEILAILRDRLQLRRRPERIECFDISTIQGRATVGSMAVVCNGEPVPTEYRHYRVRTVVGSDDYASLREVLRRRLTRGLADGLLPDLILIDGGKGQLGVLTALLDEFGLRERIDVAGIAKSRVFANARGRKVERSEERLFLPGRKNPVVLRQGSAPLFLLERLRDEAHRFAIGYHRKLRGKSQLQSVLSEIAGVGPARQKALLRHFGSLKKLREASLEELLQLPGLPATVAEQVFRFFRQQERSGADQK
ncbi:MAG: excinuclease ABC subunit UvrC [Desulfuromonadales bacterium]|nr:excinuclease ABC subunit UvrC [Desulfuromonadales bacterium]